MNKRDDGMENPFEREEGEGSTGKELLTDETSREKNRKENKKRKKKQQSL